MAELLRKGNSAGLAGHETVNQEQRSQYVRHKSNGVPAIQRDGQSVLGICDQNWDFANWLCALLNELGHMPALLTVLAFAVRVHHVNFISLSEDESAKWRP